MNKILFLFCLLLPMLVWSQGKMKQDVLALKNGTQIRGQLLEQGQEIKIKTQDGSIWVYDAKEVTSITQELNPSLFKAKGFLNMSEIGVLSGANSANAFYPERYAPFSFRSFNGYQFAPSFALGLTLGVDMYNQVVIMPVALGIRGDLLKTRVTPFYSFDIGVGSPWMSKQEENESAQGGGNWGIGLGLKIRMPSQTALTFSLGYHKQKAKLRSEWCNWGSCNSAEESQVFNRLALRMGFSF